VEQFSTNPNKWNIFYYLSVYKGEKLKSISCEGVEIIQIYGDWNQGGTLKSSWNHMKMEI
jgi:hypothetical protein